MTDTTNPPTAVTGNCTKDTCVKRTSTLQQQIASLQEQVSKDAITKLDLRSQLKDTKQKKENYKAYCTPLKEKGDQYDKLMKAATRLEASPDTLQTMLIECRERVCKSDAANNKLQEEITQLSSEKIALEDNLCKMEAFVGEYCATTAKTFDLVQEKFERNMDKRSEIARHYGMKISGGEVLMLADYGKRKERDETEAGVMGEGRELKKVMLVKVKDQDKIDTKVRDSDLH